MSFNRNSAASLHDVWDRMLQPKCWDGMIRQKYAELVEAAN